MQRSLIALVGLSAVVLAAPSDYVTDVKAEFHAKSLFDKFQKTHHKKYSTTEESNKRFGIFRENLVRINELNAVNGSPAFGINKFADLTAEEFKSTYLGYTPANVGSRRDQDRHATLVAPVNEFTAAANATKVDWRTTGAVSEVKDQGQCGSCWAFSATEQVETATFLATKKLPILAPQQIVSCDTVDQGCNGGDTPTAYAYIEQNGLEPESSYPYKSGLSGDDGTCTYKAAKATTKISGFLYATKPCSGACTNQDEKTFSTNVANEGPASICVNANAWQTYTSGVISAAACGGGAYTDLDHCVQVVGFDISGSQKYWIVRNSWASDWGEEGYIRVAYGTNACGIADEATFVTI